MSSFDESVRQRIAHLQAQSMDSRAREAAARDAHLQETETISSMLSILVGDRLAVFSRSVAHSLPPHFTEIRHRRTNKLLGRVFVVEVLDSVAEKCWYDAHPDEDPESLPFMSAYFFQRAADLEECYEMVPNFERSDQLELHHLNLDTFLSDVVSTLVDLTATLEFQPPGRG